MDAIRMYRLVGAGGAALDCSVMEEDWQRGQSYTAYWHSPPLLAQLQGPTVTELEHLEKYWKARMLLRRFLSGAIGQRLAETPSAPSDPDPSVMALRKQQDPVKTHEDAPCMRSMLESMGRKATVKMTKLPRYLG